MKPVLFALLLASPLRAEEIPLKSVWGASMPDTRSVRELEPRDRYNHGPLMREIASALLLPVADGEDAGRGFAVEGHGIAALKKAKAVIVDGEKRPKVLKAGEVTLVFYSRGAAVYVHLKEVQRQEKVISLHYQFVEHSSEDIKMHFALIPLGELPAGKYKVKHVQLLPGSASPGWPPARERLPAEWERRVVSLPYTFEVK